MFEADKPINSFKEDKLGRSEFSKQLANAILQFGPIDNYSIGLYGEWGCGKTSIINMVVSYIMEQSKNIPEDKQPIIIRFNPWNFTDCNQLISQFFVTLSETLKISNPSKRIQSVGEAIEKYSSALEYTKYIPFAGKYLRLLPSLTKAIGNTMKENASSRLNDVSFRKQEVEKSLKDLKTRIIVIIDDIDRLPNDQIRLIFQLVNSLAGFPNVIYILSFDKSIVVRALSEVQQCNGEEYLEKIIQAPFSVPDLNPEKIYNILFSKLNEIIELPDHTEFDKNHWNNVFSACIKPFVKNIRDVNRYLNTFIFQYSAIKAEVSFIDLAGITALQIFAPSIAKWIRNNKYNLIGGVPSGGISLNDINKNKESKLALCKAIYPIDPECMLDAVSSLFPNFSNSVSFRTVFTSNSELHQQMSIASQDRFNIYFSLSLDEITFTRSDIDNLIFEMGQEELLSYTESLQTNAMFLKFFSELRLHFSRIPEQRIELFVRLFFQLSGRLDREGDGMLALNPMANNMYDIQDLLYRFEDEDRRFNLLKDLLEDAGFLSFQASASLLNSIELSHGRLAANSKDAKQLILVEHLEIIEKIFILKLKVFLKTKALLEWTDARICIYLWDCFDQSACMDYLHKELQDDINVIRLISIIANRWTSSNTSNPIGYTFSKSDYEKYLSYEEVIIKINDARKNESFWMLTTEQHERVAAFILISKGVDGHMLQMKQIHELIREWKTEYLSRLIDE